MYAKTINKYPCYEKCIIQLNIKNLIDGKCMIQLKIKNPINGKCMTQLKIIIPIIVNAC